MSELQEEGRTISTATAAKLRAAHEAIGALLALVKAEESDDDDETETIEADDLALAVRDELVKLQARNRTDAIEADDLVLAEEHIELIERAVGDDGIARIRLIAPGWGSSGYYPADVLRRDGPKVFRQGLQMHLDHQTEREAKERPEGSVRTLAGVLASDVEWHDDGAAGPGLYADAKIFEQHRSMLNEMAPHIGVSIRASGKAVRGEAEGRKGHIIEAITAANTTDYVTRAGAGGVILPLTESVAEGGVGLTLFSTQRQHNTQEANVDEHELDELRAELARTKELLLLREARDVVAEALAKVDMPEPTRARLTEALAKAPPVADGVLDAEALKTRCAEAVIAELEYLAKASGAGAVKGMGTSASASDSGAAALQESFKRMYLRQGMEPEMAEKMAANAAIGR